MTCLCPIQMPCLPCGFRELRLVTAVPCCPVVAGLAVSSALRLLVVAGNINGSALYVHKLDPGFPLQYAFGGIGASGEGVVMKQPAPSLCFPPWARNSLLVADTGNDRVLEVDVVAKSVVKVWVGGEVAGPMAVAASRDVLAVCESKDDASHRVSLFSVASGSLVSRIGGWRGPGEGQLHNPRGVALCSDGRHVAVADYYNHRVSLFTVGGTFVRHVATGVPNCVGVVEVEGGFVVCGSNSVQFVSGGVTSPPGALVAMDVPGVVLSAICGVCVTDSGGVFVRDGAGGSRVTLFGPPL